MKVVIAIDSLKGSLTSLEAGAAIGEGAKKAMPGTEVVVRPLADGGEGTVEALTLGLGGELEHVVVTGPLGEPVTCAYGILKETKMAVVEMSGAAGITLIPEKKRNPLKTTTYGVGEVICDAIKKGCRHFIVGIGGSATNDGGVGMLQALGYEMLDAQGNQIAPGAEGLKKLVAISSDQVLSELKECTFKIACDVTNPLCGPLGCSSVYGSQKGADEAMIKDMDQWLGAYAELTEKWKKKTESETEKTGKLAEVPGTGAAGGLGFAFLAYTNAVLESGIRIVLDETKLEDYVKDADLVVTGEGRLDGQTVMGKAPVGVAEIAKKYGKPVIAFAGSVTADAYKCNGAGIAAYFPILRRIVTLDEAMDPETAKKNMSETAEQVFRLIGCFRK